MENSAKELAEKVKRPPKWILILIAVLLILGILFAIVFTVSSRQTKEISVSRITESGWSTMTQLLDDGGAMIIESPNKSYFYLILGKNPNGGNAWRSSMLRVEQNKNTLNLSIDTSSRLTKGTISPPIAIYRIYRDKRVENLCLIVDGNQMHFMNIIPTDKFSNYIK